MRLCLAVVIFPLVASASAPLALAEEPAVEAVTEQEVLETLVALNRKAVTQYRSRHHAEAQKLLQQALELAEQHDLGGHVITARTYVHLGIVAIAGLGKVEDGRQDFARALQIRPDIKLTKQLATSKLKQEFEAARTAQATEPASPEPEVQAAGVEPAAASDEVQNSSDGSDTSDSKDAKDAKGRELALSTRHGPGRVDEADEPDLPASVPQPLYCPTPMEGPPAADVRLHCLTQADVRAKKIVLYYRPGDGEQYTPVRMNRTRKGWYSAIIPARQVTGGTLQFYFEARNEANRLAAANGKGDLPNVIVLKPGAPPVGVGALAALTFSDKKDEQAGEEGEEETPLQLRTRQEEIDAEAHSHARRPVSRFWVGLGVGSGYGWHLKRPLENHKDRQVTAGFSPVGLGHATPEIGYQLTERLSLSLQGRHQYLPPSGSGDPTVAKGPPRTAHAVLARAQYAFLDAGAMQLLATLSAGYGSALRMSIAPAAQELITSDTVVAGPGVAGPGLAVAYNFTNKILAALEARSLAGFPKLGALLELNAGLQYAF